MDLKAYVLRFRCEVETEMSLPPFKGSTIRGALFGALRQDFCIDQGPARCTAMGVRQACPVCCLLATADETSSRGVEVARPCTIEPPLEDRTSYRAGDEFSFGVTLFGEAADLLPYAIIGARRMGEIGIGNRQRAPGKFTIRNVQAIDPLSDDAHEIYKDGDSTVRRPRTTITHDAVLTVSERLKSSSQVTFELLTPARLVTEGALTKSLTFSIIMRRLLRRLTDLTRTATGSHPGFDHEALLQQAEAVRLIDDRTRWVDVPSYSARQGRFTPIGGLVGEITFEGDPSTGSHLSKSPSETGQGLEPFVPWLLWGSVTHIGKDATKGGGWYKLRWQS